MRKALILAIGVSCTAVAFAASHIPTRYAGSFPPVGNLSNITGTYTGKRLTLNATFVSGTRIRSVTGSFACTIASSTQTRCAGAFKNDKGGGDRAVLTITWSGGRPVAMSK
jgi:threonine synthase